MELTPEIVAKMDEMFSIYEKPDSATYPIKTKFRNLAAELLTAQKRYSSPAAKRSVSLALTEIETACMYAVKAVHQG